jgi:spore coat protein A
MIERRKFMQGVAALGAGVGLPSAHAQLLSGVTGTVGGLLNGVTGTVAAVVSLPTNNGWAMPKAGGNPATVKRLDAVKQPKLKKDLPNPLDPINKQAAGAVVNNVVSYTLSIKEFASQIGLTDAAGNPLSTTLWGYSTPGTAPTSTSRTFDVRSGVPIQVTYVNELLNGSTPLPHRLGIDTTLVWANPGNLGGQAPVPLVAHRHGGLQDTLSDGNPDAWATPDANKDGKPDFRGRLYSTPYLFSNAQEAGHLWYHDHALGVTRLNLMMGLAGHYFIRDTNEDYLVARNMLPTSTYELPLLIQDRSYDVNGQLFYPTSDPANPNAPAITVLPEYFGDTIIVNGVPWPKRDVEPRPYRLRLLNGSDARFYDMQFVGTAGTPIAFNQVGTELGLMDAPVPLTRLLLAPGERADIVVDFSALAGQMVRITNSANAPFPGGAAVNPATTGQLMGFNVVLALNTANPKAVLPAFLRPVLGMLPAVASAGVPVRKLMLLEGTDPFGRLQTMLGTVNPAAGNPAGPTFGTFFYSDPVTEKVAVGSTEIWELHNTTVDAHPMHLHLVDFRVLNRQAFTGTLVPKPMGAAGTFTGGYLTNVALSGAARPALPSEAGRKDTVVCYPGEVTRILVKFPSKGEYVWHCHILSHEDHEMMRSFVVA